MPFGDFEFLNINNGDIDTVDGRANFRFSNSNLLTAGFEFERESLFQSSTPSFATFNNTTDRQRTFAVFGQDQLSFLDDRLRLSIGVRGGVIWWSRERLQSDVLREWFRRAASSRSRRHPREFLARIIRIEDPWFRLQGFGDRGRECATYGTLPCNLKAKLRALLSKQSAGQKDDAQQHVNAMIDLAQMKRANHPHACLRTFGTTQRHSQNSQREINHTENK